LISIDNFDFTTNFTAVAATLNNIGPGLELVGPTQNFSIFSTFSKYVLMFDMLTGRLELFPMLILFHPSCWKKY
jgi:trk system potassium uptake protein TrkH